ncbi:MAG: FAD-dependent oxidoreductase [Myxococcota bacterium]
MKIAIVGSGIAGLACAYHLDPRHAITLVEAEPRLGGHAHTVDVEVAGRRHAVDTGFIVYNETTYPELTRLFVELDVDTRPTEMSFGLACERTGLAWSSRGLRGLFATPSRALRRPFLRMLGEIARFEREADAIAAVPGTKPSLRELVRERGYSDAFRDGYLAPMGAAIWSAGSDALLDMPAASFVRFFRNHGLLGRGGGIRWRTVVGGSRRYVDAIARRLRGRVVLGRPVARVASEANGVRLDFGASSERFDRVVLAVHADTALGLIQDPTAEQRRILGAIRFSRNDAVLHTDASILPRNPSARASWNARMTQDSRERVVVTYDLSRLQQIPSAEPLLVSLNATDRIDPTRVLGRYAYDHPILDGPAVDAQRDHARIDGVGGLHYCGAWWRWGFHEDGLASALRVVHAIEASV